MALTKREQYILFITVICVGLFLGDRYILSPVLAVRSQTKGLKSQLQVDLTKANSTLSLKNRLKDRWGQMQETGLSNDASKTESLVLRYLDDRSKKHYLKLSSVQPERLRQKSDLQEIDFTVSGIGDMESICRFLLDIETANVPLKIKTLQLGSRDEDGKEMSVQLKLSSIYIAANPEKAE